MDSIIECPGCGGREFHNVAGIAGPVIETRYVEFRCARCDHRVNVALTIGQHIDVSGVFDRCADH